MKKQWIIKQTGDFHENKQALKEIRKKLHLKVGIDENSEEFKALSDIEKSKAMVYTISQGPDHPVLNR